LSSFGPDFLAAFTACGFHNVLTGVDPTCDDLERLGFVMTEEGAKPELPGKHDLVPFQIEREDTHYRPAAKNIAFQPDRRLAAAAELHRISFIVAKASAE
jgi:hypothetical protein